MTKTISTIVRRRMHLRAIGALILLGVLVRVPAADATQHLITAGESWHDVAAKTRPGDEIILMPGNHKRAVLAGLQGTPKAPIVIRSADPDNPSVIVAEGEGLRLLQPSHVTIRDLTISGATICGLSIEHQPNPLAMPDTAGGDRWHGAVKIENVLVRDTGPVGERHAIRCIGMRKIDIAACRVEGWGGAAIEIQGCEDVNIQRCTLVGQLDFSQRYGVRVRGGSKNVTIDRCRIDQGGGRVLCLGGSSKMEHFIPAPAVDATAASLHEAMRIRITRNIITGGGVPFTFDRTADCIARNNTIVNPLGCVIALDPVTPLEHEMLGPIDRTHFGYNMIVWEPDALTAYVRGLDEQTAEGLRMEPNLWWSEQPVAERSSLGPIPTADRIEQIVDIDPKLDEQLHPTAVKAGLFGSDAP